MAQQPDLSIIVPLYNEEANAAPLVEAVREALSGFGTWELVLVDDGSRDATAAVAARIAEADPRIRLVRLARNYGQTPAMRAGFAHARGRVVVSMDGDLQNDPRDIPRLVAALDAGYDLVAGYRERRQDRLLTRKVPSWVANRLIRWITGVPIRDNGCSLKAYRRELIQRLHLYSDMHRFIPAIAAATAGARITEIPVRHHPRRHGASKYGLSRVGKVLMDLLIIEMVRSFRERPLQMFAAGAGGAALLALAFAVAAAISLAFFRPEKADALVFPAAALLWGGLACYLLMLGLIAETALRVVRRGRSIDPVVLREEAW
ncbi:MAG TPA: glycosyltransferase family 2 protein [Longimicrobiales bacterium]